MKKIIIFTLSTGGGHNEAASNLKAEFEKCGHRVIINDVFNDLNKMLETIMVNSFNVMTGKLPKLYGLLYDFGNNEITNKIFSQSTIRLFSEKLRDIIKKEEPDLVISTHALLVNTIGRLKRKNYINIPFIAVVTDYEAHLNYINQYVDAYIAASEYTRHTLVKKGVSPDKVYPYGMPIKKDFIQAEDSAQRDSQKDEVFQILLMAGSLGLKGMYRVLKELIELEGPIRLVAVCGHNKKLKKSIDKDFGAYIESGILTLYEYVDNIPQIMRNSDVLVTKPGGFTITEAISEGLPMVIPYYIPGQEKENLEYLLCEEVAIYVRDEEDIRGIMEDLMANPSRLKEMHKKMKTMYNRKCLEDILRLSEKMMNDYAYSLEEANKMEACGE